MFAATALHEAALAPVPALSEEVLYWGAKQADKNTYPGTSFRSIHLALGKWGQPEAHFWPYDPARNDRDASYAPPPAAVDPVNCYHGRLASVPLDVATVKAHLASGRTIAVSVQMSIGFFQSVNGTVPVPQPQELIAENHAVLLTGYEDARNVFRFRNSWGISWGASGYGEMPYDYFTQHGKSAYTLHVIL